MFYAVSDIHGCYEKFKNLLDMIHFSNDSDTLFVLGDAIDRGNDSIKVLKLMMKYDHIVFLMGNHERMAYTILKQLENKIALDAEKIKRKHLRMIFPICGWWFKDGGYKTLKDYSKLRKREREQVLNYIGDALPFFQIKVNGINYILVHAGIADFDPAKELWDYKTDSFLYERIDYDRTYYKDAYIVSGHTPTDLIDKAFAGRILKKNNHIAIDCGAYWNKPLGCICLDTMEEFYSY